MINEVKQVTYSCHAHNHLDGTISIGILIMSANS